MTNRELTRLNLLALIFDKGGCRDVKHATILKNGIKKIAFEKTLEQKTEESNQNNIDVF